MQQADLPPGNASKAWSISRLRMVGLGYPGRRRNLKRASRNRSDYCHHFWVNVNNRLPTHQYPRLSGLDSRGRSVKTLHSGADM